jgi:hypothetical protein
VEKEVGPGLTRRAREILFEGLHDEDILGLPKKEMDQLILLGEPIVFRIGSATVRGSFKMKG